MISVPSGVRVWLAGGVTDMRRGMNGLTLQIQGGLKRDPHAGDFFVFGGRRGDTVKIFSGMTASAFRFTPSVSNMTGSSGRARGRRRLDHGGATRLSSRRVRPETSPLDAPAPRGRVSPRDFESSAK